MTEWEAKYKALLAGISEPSLIDNAEKIVQAAEAISRTGMPFERVFWSLMWATVGQRRIFGPPGEDLLTPKQALLTLRNTLVNLLEQWDNFTDEGCHLGSDCAMLADRWVDLVAQRKGWKE